MSIAPPAEPAPYAAFILQTLLRPTAPVRGAPRAVTETEHPILGDHWFWADDNAKALELLALPAIWPHHPAEVEEVFRFLADLCHGPFIFRRVSHPRLERMTAEGGRTSFRHGLLQIEAELARGRIGVGMRFHDGRDSESLILGGHRVTCTLAGKRQTLVAEEPAEPLEPQLKDGVLVLGHRQELHGSAGWGRSRRLGTLTCTARFRADSALFEVELALEVDPAAEASDIALVIGQQELSHGRNGVSYDALHGLRAGGGVLLGLPGKAEHTLAGSAAAPYWCIAQGAALRGFALGIHTVPREPGRIAALHAAPASRGLLGWVGAEHAFPGPQAGATLVAAETRLITSGGFYDQPAEYAALLSDPAWGRPGRPVDLSISYDYGAELTAFARLVRGARAAGAQGAAVRAEAQSLYDALLGTYRQRFLAAEEVRPGSVFSRPLAFVVQSLCDMVQATGEDRYRTALEEAVEALLGFGEEQADVAGAPSLVFLMGRGADAQPYMDCHAAALLALVRAVPLLPPALHARAVRAIGLAMEAFSLATVCIEFEGPRRQDTVVVDFAAKGGRKPFDAFWNFAAGLALRAFRALQRSPDAELQRIAAAHEERIGLMRTVMTLQIRRSLRQRGEAVEVRTSVLSGETNSETQPWVALAMVRQAGDG
jgi:hypothetical protein